MVVGSIHTFSHLKNLNTEFYKEGKKYEDLSVSSEAKKQELMLKRDIRAAFAAFGRLL